MKRKKLLPVVLVLLITLLAPISTQAVETDISQYKPYALSVKQMAMDTSYPSGSAELTFKINDLPRGDANAPWGVYIEKKIGYFGKWYGVSFVPSDLYLDIPENNLGDNTYRYLDMWKENYPWKADTVVYFRVKTALCDASFSAIAETPWSNIASIGFKASAWAIADIQQAEANGLIPLSINGDFTRPITREEIADLSVKLYEKITQKSAEPVAINPFLDTINPEVLKSSRLAIVEGITANKFAPLALTDRQQIATMLFRAVKAIKPTADFSIIGAPKFADEKAVASWAAKEVQFMAKQGFIKGVGNKRFAPKATTSCEQAIAIVLRVHNYYTGTNK